MKKSIFIILFILSILGASCNRQDRDVRSFSDADIQELKVNIEKDQLWKDYISIMHNLTNAVTSHNLYVEEALYKNPPNIGTKLDNVKSNEEALKVLLSLGFTKTYADLMIKWLDCIKKLQQKFPEMTRMNPQKLNLKVPLPEEYPFNATKNPKGFLDKRNMGKD